jgi:hypothetical protein
MPARHTAISPIVGPIAIGVVFCPGSGFLRLRVRCFIRRFLASIMHEVVRATQSHSSCNRSVAGVFWSKAMIFSRDYVGYLARQTVKHLVDAKMIETAKHAVLNERVTAAMIDELALEDRINDEVRVILDAFQEDMLRTGANYQEMFKKVKNELTRKYKAVL